MMDYYYLEQVQVHQWLYLEKKPNKLVHNNENAKNKLTGENIQT